MLMTACDLSAVTKDWPIQRRVAELVAAEFYDQGELERQVLKREPSDQMNRDKIAELPRLQCQFIDFICEPLYGAFARLAPTACRPLTERLALNRANWSRSVEEQNRKLETDL